MSKGYVGRGLFVDLNSGAIEDEALPERVYRDFLGGEGLGIKVIYERTERGLDPLGPENILSFAAGLLNGTPAPMTPRYVVSTKSPLTQAWGQANAGGYFGPELKAAGFDAVFVTGISPEPVYLLIREGRGELRKASHLWGKDTVETEKRLREELRSTQVQVACIGPSGESLSLISCIMSGGRAAARCGVGAVMGAKRLKAIAAVGSKEVPIADPERVRALRKRHLKTLRESKDMIHRVLKEYGTCGIVSSAVMAGDAPIKNWTLAGAEAFPGADRISDRNVTRYVTRKYACFRCPVGCGGIVEIERGPYALKEGRKPEYETLAGFGALCLNDDVASIIYANDICDRYGLDTISASSALAFAIECYEEGLIGKEDTDGIELTWGNAPAMIAMLYKMARREGFGGVLADGVKRAAEQVGGQATEYGVHVGGQEPGFRHPRLLPGRLAYITDAAPGRHTSSTVQITFEKGDWGPCEEFRIAREELKNDRDRGRLYAIGSKYHAVVNCSGLCSFAVQMGSVPYPLTEFIAAVTGWDFTLEEALVTGHRIQTLRQAFVSREGISPQDVRFPERMSRVHVTGPLAGNEWDFERLGIGFYEAMGWETHGDRIGCPLPQTLRDLGLETMVARP